MRSNPKQRVLLPHTRFVTAAATLKARAKAPCGGVGAAILALGILPAMAQPLPSVAPSVLDPHLAVRKVAFGLNQPTSMAFIGTNDILVLDNMLTAHGRRPYKGARSIVVGMG